MNIQYTSRSSNGKIGNVPQAFMGDNYEETKRSCHGCEEYNVKQPGKSRCYSHSGTGMLSAHSVFRAKEKGKRYDLKTALSKATRSAKMVRFTAIGDPSAAIPSVILSHFDKVRAAGLDVVGYTHMWRDSPHLAGHLMASCNASEVVEAMALGFRAAVIVPWRHLIDGGALRFDMNGADTIICPAQRPKSKLTCNDCRLCDGSRTGAPNIAFLDHSKKATIERKRYERSLLEVK